MDGPDAVLNSSELNKPIITDNTPPTIDKIIICRGLLLKFLAIAAGIKSKPVINKTPTILIEIAITPAKRMVKIKLDISGFIPSAAARS